MDVRSEKKPYTTPKVTVYGDVKAITQQSTDGQYLDQSFPAGTDRGSLTFS
jgi:hypothetical protein